MTFTDLYPRPDADTATASDVAGWRAAQALYLLGRADRRRELHGPADSTMLHNLVLAAAHTDVARALYALSIGTGADTTARHLLVAAEAGDDTSETAEAIAQWAGHIPNAARAAGYES